MPDKAPSDTSREPGISRNEALKRAFGIEDFEPEMPPVDCGNHLLAHLWKRGPTLAGAMGQSALTDVDLAAFQSNSGIELSEWEATTLIRLSRDYLGESGAATKPDRKPPFETADFERLRRHQLRQKMQKFLHG